MFTSSRPTANRFARRILGAAAVVIGLLGISATRALATTQSSTTTSAEAAVCPGQTFSQPFAAEGDTNYYTLVPGGEFNSPSEGWLLYNGARILGATRPSGAAGGVLDLPSGALAISPPVCVTLQYPTARVWVRDVKGSEGVAVAVAYLGTKFGLTSPQNVGHVHGQQSGWTLSSPIDVQPQIVSATEGPREARFVFLATGHSEESQLSGLYVDPRMR
jgi:hypothetical protein